MRFFKRILILFFDLKQRLSFSVKISRRFFLNDHFVINDIKLDILKVYIKDFLGLQQIFKANLLLLMPFILKLLASPFFRD